MPTAPCNMLCEFHSACPNGVGCLLVILDDPCGPDKCMQPPDGGGGFALATKTTRDTIDMRVARGHAALIDFIMRDPLAETVRVALAEALAARRKERAGQ